jgi:hypothetical protein
MGTPATGTNLIAALTGSSLYAIVQAGANRRQEQEVPTGTNLLATGSDWVAFTESTVYNNHSTGSNDRTGTNMMALIATDANWFDFTESNGSAPAEEQEPKRIRSHYYYRNRKVDRQIVNLHQQLERQQKATTVGEALLTQFSGGVTETTAFTTETTALRSALEM